MSLIEKRYDAAQTLVVPYDATPEMVDAAYERRLAQRFNLDNSDLDSMSRGFEVLYDAHIRMRMSERTQWLAQLRLMLTDGIDRTVDIAKIGLKQIRNELKSDVCREIVDDVTSSVRSAYRKYNVFRGICAYEIGGVWGLIIYNHATSGHNPIVPLAISGSMFAGVCAIWFMRGTLTRSIKQCTAKFEAMRLILPYDKLLSRTL